MISIFDWIGLFNQIIDWICDRYRLPNLNRLDWIGLATLVHIHGAECIDRT